MATLQSMAANYDRAMQTAPAAYNAAKARMPGRYSEEMQQLLGGPVAPHILAKYQSGVSAAQYRAGSGAYMAQRYREKMTGG